ncbi:MAG: hypothetical protein AVDCRST_MAG59-3955, partial [uncultured Thermomicrobiales bacterium]
MYGFVARTHLGPHGFERIELRCLRMDCTAVAYQPRPVDGLEARFGPRGSSRHAWWRGGKGIVELGVRLPVPISPMPLATYLPRQPLVLIGPTPRIRPVAEPRLRARPPWRMSMLSVRQTEVFPGPSLWAPVPAVRLVVDTGALAGGASRALPG